jgi:hypothetical protein
VTSTPHLIGLYSPAPRSGKTTVAAYLTEHGYYRAPFAGPLKRMIRTFLRELGHPNSAIDHHLEDGKADVIPGIRTTSRHLLQTLGTEWGRSCVHPDVWLMCWRETATSYLNDGVPVVVDDLRFPNEADLIRALGGQLWHIHRPSTKRGTTHSSEGSLDAYPFDHHLTNDGSLTDLYEQVSPLLSTPALAAA